jgi:gliding motility-associated-like protein
MDNARQIISKLFFCTLLFSTLFIYTAKAQTPSKCFEIESILVDACIDASACPGGSEGENEMVRFVVGPNPINISDIDIAWPANLFKGISPKNAITTALVNTLNATILSCGKLIEPVGGVLPAGKRILLITSTDMCTAANSFANLNDTLYVIFQIAGNSGGHFGNYVNATSSIKTLTITQMSTSCYDIVSYDKALLVDQAGNHTAQDGATVEYTFNGSASYVNNACNAPLIPLTVNAGIGQTICSGDSVNLVGTETGGYSGVIWQAASGTFSTPTLFSTNYKPTITSGSISVSFGVIDLCNDTVFSHVIVTVNSQPTAPSTSSINYCQNETAIALTPSGTTFLWYTAASGGVGSTSAPIPNTSTIGITSFYVSEKNGGCESARTILTVSVNTSPIAGFTTSPTPPTGDPPLVIAFTNTSQNIPTSVNYNWNFGDQTFSTLQNPPNVTYQTPGNYEVNLIVSDNGFCADTAKAMVIILDDFSLVIPNVFTPNGDEKNDEFIVSGIGIKDFECTIYDRWGIKMAEFKKMGSGWNGTTISGQQASTGTYYYTITASGLNSKPHNPITGYVLLTR